MEKSITKIFTESQTTVAVHTKLIKKLITIYLKSDFQKFCNCFINLAKHSLIHGEKQPTIERTLSFIAQFVTSVKSEEEEAKELDEDEVDIDPFLVFVFGFLLKNHEANSKSVRFRVCQLINKILNNMGEQASIDDELYSTIYDTMLQRLMDKVPAIRVQAIFALSRLQDPRNKECPVITAYLFHLSMDPNAEVRRSVLINIAITYQTLPDILERIKDTKDLVRRQAYLILAQKVHIRSFTIAQRVLIVSQGLNDRSEMVRQAVKKNVLQAWLRLVEGNILEFLKSLDVEASTESAELALNSLFEDVPYLTLVENFNFLLADKKMIAFEDLTPESALYWRCLAKHLRAEKADDFVEDILPDLSVFCQYMQDYIMKEAPMEEEDPQETAVKMMEKDFVCQQLISLSTVFDMSDEVGRKSLCTLVRQLLMKSSVGEICIKNLSEVFAQLTPPVARVTELAEIISDLREPPDVFFSPKEEPITPQPLQKEALKLREDEERKHKIKVAQISVKLNQVREELEDCVRTLNLQKAQELKEALQSLEEEKTKIIEAASATPLVTPVKPCSQAKMPEEEEVKLLEDPMTLTRCLFIVCEFLSSPDLTTFGSTLRSIHDNLILPCLKSEDLGVRRHAVRSLALICLLSKEMAQQHLLLFVQISQMDVEEIQSEALHGLFDFWLLYGVQELNCEDVGELPAFVDTDIKEEADVSDSQDQAVGNVIALLTKMLETESSDARTLTVEGLCKLLMTSRIYSSKLLSHLIILWYNPTTEDDNLLRNLLGVFFPLYASLGGSCQESLCGALLPTLHTIFNAPTRSPLSDIDVDDVVNFMISVTSPSIVSNKSENMYNAHDSLVFTVCAEILAFPDRDYSRPLIRGLSHFHLTPSNFATLRQVECLTQKMAKKLDEKSLITQVDKFHQSIKNLLQLAPSSAGEDEGEKTLVEEKDNEVTLIENVSQYRRKRQLYTSQNDMELISDLDSENERTPSKLKRLADTSDDSDLEGEKTAEVEEQETEDQKPIVVTSTKEIELTMVDENPKSGHTSSDLFATSEERGSELDVENISEITGRESETDEVIDDPSLSSSCTESPQKKPARLQRSRPSRTSVKRSHPPSSPDSVSSTKDGSSSSFYSARSTSSISPEVLTAPKQKRTRHSGRSTSSSANTIEEPPKTVVTRKSLRTNEEGILTRRSSKRSSTSTSDVEGKTPLVTRRSSKRSSTSTSDVEGKTPLVAKSNAVQGMRKNLRVAAPLGQSRSRSRKDSKANSPKGTSRSSSSRSEDVTPKSQKSSSQESLRRSSRKK